MRRAKPDQLELPLRFRHRQAVGRAHLALEGKLVSYTIKRSPRRRAISILVDEEGLRVGAPWNATHNAIEQLLRTHAQWVLRKLDEWRVRRAPPRRWADGEPLMLLGGPLTLKLVPGGDSVRVHGSELLVGTATAPQPSVSRLVQQWLHSEALHCYRERVEHYRRALGVEIVPQVHLSAARTRWGTCHTSGRIHLNWRLIQMPLRLIDYVVAHEVAHLVELNHSDRFWALVEWLYPHWREARERIERAATTIPRI